MKTFCKLLISVLLLTGTMMSGGTQSVPYTLTTCIPSAAPQKLLQLVDGTECIPWTPSTCFPKAFRS